MGLLEAAYPCDRRPPAEVLPTGVSRDARAMKIDGLQFPSDADVAAEEAARFREASPAEQMRAVRSILAGGAQLIHCSPRRPFIEAYRQQQEDLAREAITRFVMRHAGRT